MNLIIAYIYYFLFFHPTIFYTVLLPIVNDDAIFDDI